MHQTRTGKTQRLASEAFQARPQREVLALDLLEFAKLLGARALYRYFITLIVIKIIKFLEKMKAHHW
jgi:hypothetical protein